MSRRCKQSSCTQEGWLCLSHSWSSCRQEGHATQNLYRNPLRCGSSRAKSCKVPSTNDRTLLAISSECDIEAAPPCVMCFSNILMNLFLQIRIKLWTLCAPITNRAPFWYRFGGCVHPVAEHQDNDFDISCEKRPWGTKPSTNWRYNGQGSEGEGSICKRHLGDGVSWAGTKYFTSVGETENYAIKPNRSIMSKISSLIIPCWRNLEKTWSTSSILRTPLCSTSCQYLDCTGS